MNAARVQVTKEQAEATQPSNEELGTFNIWYNNWSTQSRKKKRSPFRLNVQLDSGTTSTNGPFFCIWFARGMCTKGKECNFLHRVPNILDCQYIDHTHDCFGRWKHGEFRDDQRGIGSLSYEQTSIFVGTIKHCDQHVQQIKTTFNDFGNIVKIKCGPQSAIIEYDNFLSAQFAKEAMTNQTVTGKETLFVNWARTDAHKINSNLDQEMRTIVQQQLGAKKQKIVSQ